MEKWCIAFGLCAVASLFSLSQFASWRRRDDDVGAVCALLTCSGVPARVRHWALNSPILKCAEYLSEEHEEGMRRLASSDETKGTKSRLTHQQPEAPSFISPRMQYSVPWQGLDSIPRTRAAQTPVQNNVDAETSTETSYQPEQRVQKKSAFVPEPVSTSPWQDQDITPRTAAVKSTFKDHAEATTNTTTLLGSKQRAGKSYNSTQLSEASASWQDQGTAPMSTKAETTVPDCVETATSTELDVQLDQQEEKKSLSAPGPEHSTSRQYQQVIPCTVTAHSTVDEYLDATSSPISELEPGQQADKTASCEPETSYSWQNEDIGLRTATAQQSTVKQSVETIKSSKSDCLLQQRSEKTLAFAQQVDFSTSRQDPGSAKIVAELCVKDRAEVTTTNEPHIEEREGPKLVCYFTSWSIYRDDRGRFMPEDIKPNLCTHIIYAFSTLDPVTLQIRMADPFADEEMGLYKRVTALKAGNRRLKVLLSLGGALDRNGPEQKYSRLAANATARRNFAHHAASFLAEHSFDGLDVDWEYPNCDSGECPSNPPDKENFVRLLEDLHAAFDENSPPLLLTAALAGGIEYIEAAYHVPDIFKQLEFASIMAYDYYGSWSTVVGHHAPLQAAIDETKPEMSIEYAVHALLSMGAPASQLVLGVPFYAITFTLDNPRLNGIGSPSKGSGKSGNVTKSPSMLSYYEICSAIKAGGWSTMKDPRAGVYAYSGDQWVSFDGPSSVTRKARFAQRLGLAGLMAWDLSMDDFRGECGRVRPLLSAARGALYPPTTTPAGSGRTGRLLGVHEHYNYCSAQSSQSPVREARNSTKCSCSELIQPRRRNIPEN